MERRQGRASKRGANPRYKNGSKRREVRETIKRRHMPCALCGLPIDYSLPAGHPLSYELDEIVPVSKGGSPIKLSNLQPAHRICNQRRSNKTMQEWRELRRQSQAIEKIKNNEKNKDICSRKW